jgi:hypothetical protein
MADTDKSVNYGVTADASEFEKGMQKAADAAKGAAASVDAEFKKIGNAFAEVQKHLLLLAGIVAGGAFFKEAISASNQLTAETLKLSKMLGITGEEAGTLRTALEDIGSSGDDYVAVFTKFGRQLKSNEAGLQSLGIATRDSNGNLRDSNTLFTEALQSVGQYKSGLDQNTYAQTVFGKSIDDVMKLQKLNNKVLEEARQKNEELGLTITQDNVAASKAYKLAMNDVGDVLMAVKKVVGDAVMPIFTELAQYFASTGPYVVAVFKGALMALVTVFEVVKGVVKTVAGSIFEGINMIIDGAGLLGKIMVQIIRGNYVAGLQNFQDAGNDVAAAVKKHYDTLYGAGKAFDAPKSGTKRMGDFGKSNGTGTEKSRTGEWEAQLAEQKLAYQEQNNEAGTFYQFSKQQELKFWQDKLTLTAQGGAENIAVRRKLADLQLGINTDVFNHEVAMLQAQEAAFKQNMDAKLAILDQQSSLMAQRYGRESKEYEEVQKKIVEAKRQAAEQIKQIDLVRTESSRNAALADIQLQEQQAQLERDLRVLTDANLIALQGQFEDKRFAVQMQGLQERLTIAAADPDGSPVAHSQIYAQMEELERQHQERLAVIRGNAARESSSAWTNMYSTMESGFNSVIAKTLQGGLTLKGLFQGMWQAVVQAVTGALAQVAAKWLMETVVAQGLSKLKALSQITANAGIAGAAAVASTAAIPIVGPELAPAAGAAAFASAMAFLPFASAAGGYDIPSTINPLVQAHASEMVLPAKHADVIRQMADDGGASRGGGDVNVTIAAHPMPGNYFMVHRDKLVQAMKSAQRDNAWKPTA